MRANVVALRERAPTSPLLARFEDVARALCASRHAQIQDGIEFVEELARDLEVPGLSRYGVSSSDIPDLVTKACAASSMKGNPIALTPAELTQILERAL
jgi:alcohol dehydrogenase class IV